MKGPYIMKHFELLESIQTEKDPEIVRQLCELDAGLAEGFKKEWAAEFPKNPELPRYPAFQKLALYYERAGDYKAAIAICEKAIALGFTIDGTKGGMKGRLDRLKRKSERK